MAGRPSQPSRGGIADMGGCTRRIKFCVGHGADREFPIDLKLVSIVQINSAIQPDDSKFERLRIVGRIERRAAEERDRAELNRAEFPRFANT